MVARSMVWCKQPELRAGPEHGPSSKRWRWGGLRVLVALAIRRVGRHRTRPLSMLVMVAALLLSTVDALALEDELDAPVRILRNSESLELWAPANLACTVLLIRPDHSAIELAFGRGSRSGRFWGDRPTLWAPLHGIPPGIYLWEMTCALDTPLTTIGRVVVLDSAAADRQPLPAVWAGSPHVDHLSDDPNTSSCGTGFVPSRRVHLRLPVIAATGPLTARARITDGAGHARTEFAAIADNGLVELVFEPAIPGRQFRLDLCIVDERGSQLCWHETIELVPKPARLVDLESFLRERAGLSPLG
ncbi:MAG: hypothetical protein KJO07_13805 [Deltaproteobacteria bacterium]|nr:hypothetical protein [Deltaproteobacteria bacterium]